MCHSVLHWRLFSALLSTYCVKLLNLIYGIKFGDLRERLSDWFRWIIFRIDRT